MPSSAPITLWLTDRSRWKTGLSRCPRQRYLHNHFGPTGYGITTKAESVPLATGKYVHAGLEGFMRHLQQHDALPDVHLTRALVVQVCEQYESRVEERGFRGMLQSDHTDETIQEQKVLISGLLWALRLKFLPWFHEQFRVVEVEQERLHLLSCACGAGSLPIDVHLARGCEGRALMIRTDCLAQRRTSRSLAYFECKTTGWDSEAWAEQWETDPQLGLGTLDLAETYGAEVSELYILTLSKGARRRDKYDEVSQSSGRKRQLSPLCYGYVRPGNPPLQPEDWLPGYEWIDSDGLVKRASRQHKKKGVWLLGESDWPTYQAYHAQDPELGAAEFWVRNLPSSVLDKICFLLGPMNRQDHQILSVVRGMGAEEARWQTGLWELYELQQQHVWGSEAVQYALDRLFPQSWNCRPYGKDHQCEFVPICHREVGWDQPLLTGRYVPRLPHHTPERDQAVARGLIAADAFEEDGED